MEIDKLWQLYKEEKDIDVRERLLMNIWLKKGKNTYEVAGLLSCPQSKVMYWKSRFEKEGLNGLKTRPRSGKPPKLSEDKMKGIREKLESVNWWQTKWVKDLIYREKGVIYSQRQIVRLLHAWGFERIRPRKEHSRADKQEQKAFSKKTDSYWILCQKVGL